MKILLSIIWRHNALKSFSRKSNSFLLKTLFHPNYSGLFYEPRILTDIFTKYMVLHRIKKKMKLMGKMKTKAWFQVLIFESIFTHGRETSRHMRLLFDDHFLYGSDESEKKIYRAIYLPCSMYARIIWGAQCQVKSPKLPFYCFISFEMAFYLLSPCVKNFFKGALIF